MAGREELVTFDDMARSQMGAQRSSYARPLIVCH